MKRTLSVGAIAVVLQAYGCSGSQPSSETDSANKSEGDDAVGEAGRPSRLDRVKKLAKDPQTWKKAKEVYEKLSEIYELSEQTRASYEAAKALAEAGENLAPEEQLRHLTALFNAGRVLLPKIPVIDSFLEYYASSMDAIAGAIAEIRKNIVAANRMGNFVANPSAWPGGKPVYDYMVKLIGSPQSVPVPKEMDSYLRPQSARLAFVVGSLPYKWPDRGYAAAKEDLREWAFNHRTVLRHYLYGGVYLTQVELNSQRYANE